LKELILVLTAQCNSNCSYCYQTARSPLRLDWDTLVSSIDRALELSPAGLKVVFVGGEPLLEFPNIQKAVEHASGRRVEYAISTNGSLLDAAAVSFFDEHDFEIQLSFDGVEQAQDYRQKGSFARLDRLLDELRAKNPRLFRGRLRISATLAPAAIPHAADSVRYFLAKGVRHVAIAPSVTGSAGWEELAYDELDRQFAQIFQESLQHYRDTGQVPLTLFRKLDGEETPHAADGSMCGVWDRDTTVVDADGREYLCAMFAESYQPPPPFLDPEIFRHKERKYSSYRRCGDCEYLRECAVCPVSIAHIPGNRDPHRIPDFLCAFNQITLHHRTLFPPQPSPLHRLLNWGRT
jgi:sulfatase maturation enzyme AslB (radical SAM superfamily)